MLNENVSIEYLMLNICLLCLFRFDDIFLGMAARKGNLRVFHHPEFHFNRPPYTVQGYQYTIASHGFSDPDEMHKIWEEQRSVGSA